MILPVHVIGARARTCLVRDGGVPGIVIRLGRGFNEIKVEGQQVARRDGGARCQSRARGGGGWNSRPRVLSRHSGFDRRRAADERRGAWPRNEGLPDQCARVDPEGNIHVLSLADMGFTYRHAGVPESWIFTEATYEGSPGDPAEILKEMDEVADYREKNQPIKERTGGSTFKNPPGHSAWKLVDDAGCRGLRVGGAKVSEMHCNFLINDKQASGEDVEMLGETVRARVKSQSGIALNWEIIRLGLPKPGRPIGEALATETLNSPVDQAQS